MSVIVDGVVRDLGEPYVDGTPRLEIHIPIGRTEGLPVQIGERVPVRLHVSGDVYDAGLRATSENKYAWVCPDVVTGAGGSTSLGRVLTAAGFAANDPVRLGVVGSSLTVRRA